MFFNIIKGEGYNGYAALDDLKFDKNADCSVAPDWANPFQTTPSPSTHIPPSKGFSG